MRCLLPDKVISSGQYTRPYKALFCTVNCTAYRIESETEIEIECEVESVRDSLKPPSISEDAHFSSECFEQQLLLTVCPKVFNFLGALEILFNFGGREVRLSPAAYPST